MTQLQFDSVTLMALTADPLALAAWVAARCLDGRPVARPELTAMLGATDAKLTAALKRLRAAGLLTWIRNIDGGTVLTALDIDHADAGACARGIPFPIPNSCTDESPLGTRAVQTQQCAKQVQIPGFTHIGDTTGLLGDTTGQERRSAVSKAKDASTFADAQVLARAGFTEPPPVPPRPPRNTTRKRNTTHGVGEVPAHADDPAVLAARAAAARLAKAEWERRTVKPLAGNWVAFARQIQRQLEAGATEGDLARLLPTMESFSDASFDVARAKARRAAPPEPTAVVYL